MARVVIKESVADFPAAEENLEKIRSFLRDRLIETPLAKKEITGLLLAAEEVVTNIIRHGYLYGPGNIRIRVAHDRRRAALTFLDSGRTFEWPKKGSIDHQKMIETSRKGGLGLVLIERVCDDVDYRRTPAGENQLTLTKNFQAPRHVGMGLSLRWRWAAAGIAVSTLLAVAFFVIAGIQAGANIRENYFAAWINLARTAASASSNLVINRATDVEFDELALKLARPDSSVEYLVITEPRGMILADSRRPENVRTLYRRPFGTNRDRYDTPQAVGGDDEKKYYLVSPVLVDRQTVGFIHLGIDGTAIAAEQKAMRVRLAIYSGGGLLLGWLLSVVFSGWFIRPLKRLSGSVRGLAGRPLDEQSSVRGGDEIQQIMEAFNTAAGQIHQAEKTHYSRELARREWETAEQLQKALVMSESPEIPGFEIGTGYRSAKYVGGDWFDVFGLDDRTFVVTVADVSGKGVPGALVMATVRTAVRLLAEKYREPAALLSAVNQFATKNMRSGMFVTMLLAVIDSRAGTVNFASAGHTPLLFYRRAEKEVFGVNPKGWPLGMQLPEGTSFDSHLETGNQPIEPGDVLVLFTDGVSEARNAEKEQFGIERLKNLVAKRHKWSADRIAEAIFAEVTEFTSNGPAQDDIAAVVVKRTLQVVDQVELPGDRPVSSIQTALSRAMEIWSGDQTDSLNKRLLQIVTRHPEFDLTQICLELGRHEYESLQVDEQTVRSRLLHLRLDDRQSRREFADWTQTQQES